MIEGGLEVLVGGELMTEEMLKEIKTKGRGQVQLRTSQAVGK